MKVHGPGWLWVPPGAAEYVKCKFSIMHKQFIELTTDFSQNTGHYLVDYWRLKELRLRHWSQRNPQSNIEAHKNLYNIQLIMQEVWKELERRAETFPTEALLLLIETGASFSMNLNPKP